MKLTFTKKTKIKRAAQIALAGAATAFLFGCGGGDNTPPPPGGVELQVVSFGDSLSDVGTYAPFASQFGGGRYTTNPGLNWTQLVAINYGDTLTAAETGGFGVPVTDNANGYSYAQGGAMILDATGVGNVGTNAGAITKPVTQQLTDYLNAHGHAFNDNQLVLVEGGANDILQAFNLLTTLTPQESVQQANVSVRQATAVSTPALPPATVQALQNAAGQQIENIRNILAAGQSHVVVVNVPDLAVTPMVATLPQEQQAQAQATVGLLVSTFNAALHDGLQSDGLLAHVIYIDAQTWLDGEVSNATNLGFTTTNTDTACDLTKIGAGITAYAQLHPEIVPSGSNAQDFGSSMASSLFCSPNTLKATNADQTYMFADSVHPTTKLYALFAQYVEQQIAAAGVGK